MQLLEDDNRLYSVQDFARRLRISPRTLETLIARGEAPPVIRIGKLRRWKPEDITTWLDSRRERVTEANNNSLNDKE